jgi:hypothetical protein
MPMTDKHSENFTRNRTAYEKSKAWTKLEDHDHDSQLLANLFSLVDPDVFQEAIDDIAE